MSTDAVLLDTDSLSALSRGHPEVSAQARIYLRALREGKPFHRQMAAFETLVQNCLVLPFDEDAAGVAAVIGASCSRSQRQSLGDILIASIAISRQLPLVTRNKRDFEGFVKASSLNLRLVDWTTPTKTKRR
jgi:predicted nucleic acid-binding protein